MCNGAGIAPCHCGNAVTVPVSLIGGLFSQREQARLNAIVDIMLSCHRFTWQPGSKNMSVSTHGVS